MKAVIQRVLSASVEIDNQMVSSIGQGMLVLLGIGIGDEQSDADYIQKKIINLRIFNDDQGKINKSIQEIGGQILLVSQFTLYGDVRKGNRPSFMQAMAPDQSEPFYGQFVLSLKEKFPRVQTGVFGADMKVSLINNGPITILLDSNSK